MEQTVPKMLRKVAAEYPEVAAQWSKNKEGVFEPVLYRDLYKFSLDFHILPWYNTDNKTYLSPFLFSCLPF